jgi:hypothetical protein
MTSRELASSLVGRYFRPKDGDVVTGSVCQVWRASDGGVGLHLQPFGLDDVRIAYVPVKEFLSRYREVRKGWIDVPEPSDSEPQESEQAETTGGEK